MGRITTGVGLVSGINSKDIIDQLMALEGQQKTNLVKRQTVVTNQKKAYGNLISQLGLLQTSGKTFARPTTFNTSKASSSNENVLTATAGTGAAVGSYQIQVARLVTSQQSISKGFSNFDTAPVGAGTIIIEQGPASLKYRSCAKRSSVAPSSTSTGSRVRCAYRTAVRGR